MPSSHRWISSPKRAPKFTRAVSCKVCHFLPAAPGRTPPSLRARAFFGKNVTQVGKHPARGAPSKLELGRAKPAARRQRHGSSTWGASSSRGAARTTTTWQQRVSQVLRLPLQCVGSLTGSVFKFPSLQTDAACAAAGSRARKSRCGPRHGLGLGHGCWSLVLAGIAKGSCSKIAVLPMQS